MGNQLMPTSFLLEKSLTTVEKNWISHYWSLFITGLASDTDYTVHVVAYNSEGSSPAAIMPVATGNQTSLIHKNIHQQSFINFCHFRWLCLLISTHIYISVRYNGEKLK